MVLAIVNFFLAVVTSGAPAISSNEGGIVIELEAGMVCGVQMADSPTLDELVMASQLQQLYTKAEVDKLIADAITASNAQVTQLIADAKASALADAQTATDAAIKLALGDAMARIATLEADAAAIPEVLVLSSDATKQDDAPRVEVRATGTDSTQTDGAGIGFAVTHPGPNSNVSATASMHISSVGNVGFGVSNPEDRVSVDGNVRLTGDLLLGADASNVLELVISLREDLDQAVAESLSAQVKYSSCAQAYTTLKEKSGSAPESGSYALQGASAVWKAYCVMDDTELGLKAGWLRVGVDGMNLNVIKENEKALDVELITPHELAMLRDVGEAQVKGFTKVEYNADIHFAMSADDSETAHSVWFIDNREVFDPNKKVLRAHIEYGYDRTMLFNYEPDRDMCNGEDPQKAGTSPDCATEPTSSLFCQGDRDNKDCGGRGAGHVYGTCSACGLRNMPETPEDGSPNYGQTKDILLSRIEFRPRSGYAPANANGPQWHRNEYSVRGTTYFVYYQ